MAEIKSDSELKRVGTESPPVSDEQVDSPSAGPIGIDVGSCKIVVCQNIGGQVTTNNQLNAFFDLPYRKFTQDILDRNQVTYFLDNGSLVIIGNEAEKFAVIMNAEIRRPMREGLLNPVEPMAQKVIKKIIDLLITPPQNLGETVCLNVPAVPSGLEPRLIYHEAVLKDLLMAMGYRVKVVNEGLATVYAALEATQFNGIGISFGAGMCNGCLSYLSIPVLTFGYLKGGDYIDQSVASVMDMLPSEVRVVKEAELDLSRSPANRVESALQVFHDELMRSALAALKDAVRASNNLPQIHRPMPMVLGGGTVLPKGFLDRFKKILSEFNFPIAISEVRLVDDPLTATARGAHLAAVAEEIPEAE